ncbi:hypothetical protein ACWCXB_19565 [Streptomyces sp. NPDC001514]
MAKGVDIAVEPQDLAAFGGYLRELAGGDGLGAIRSRVESINIPEVDGGTFPGTMELKATVDSTRNSILEELAALADFLNQLGDDLVEASQIYRDSEQMAQATVDELGRLLSETSEFIDQREAKLAKEQERETGETSDIADERSRRDDADNPNVDDEGNVIDEDADGDNNGVKDGDQYVEDDADLNDDGELDDFEREYGDRDDDGKLDNKDDAEGNDLPVDEDPGDDPTDGEDREYEQRSVGVAEEREPESRQAEVREREYEQRQAEVREREPESRQAEVREREPEQRQAEVREREYEQRQAEVREPESRQAEVIEESRQAENLRDVLVYEGDEDDAPEPHYTYSGDDRYYPDPDVTRT